MQTEYAQPREALRDVRSPAVPLRRLGTFVHRKPLAACGGLLVLAVLFAALFAPVLAPYGYSTGRLADTLQGPSRAHLLGTDWVGRDVLSRLLYGARSAVLVGFGSTACAMVLATLLGVGASYFRTLDLISQRLIEIWMSLPALVLLLTILSVFHSGLVQIVVVLGLVLGAGSSRVIRSSALVVMRAEHITAARMVGAGDLRLLWRHILPNVLPTILVLATAQVGSAVLAEAALGFLGYGVPPPRPTWGQMLSVQGMTYFTSKPLLIIWPGLAIMLTVFGFNMLGDGLRDVLDPRMRGSR